MTNSLYEILNYILLAQAQAAPDALPQPAFTEILSKMMPMFAIVFFIFYFMVVKPQQQKLKSQETLLNSLKKSDEVVTTGGIVGKVAGFEEDCVLLDVSNSVRLKIERTHISKLKEKKTAVEKSAA